MISAVSILFMRDYGKGRRQYQERRETVSASPAIIDERNRACSGDTAGYPKDTSKGLFEKNSTAYHFPEAKPGNLFEAHRKQAAAWPVTKMIVAAKVIAVIPVFAKSVLHGAGYYTSANTLKNAGFNL
ncbi:hypothetical protein ACGVWS_03230 [Enterobacteriaceae bacterium LUAb1]